MMTPRQGIKAAGALSVSAVASAPDKPGKKRAPTQRSSGSGRQTRPTQHPPAGNVPPSTAPEYSKAILDSVTRFFASLRLTVVCLAVGLVLVFAGTIAQVDMGTYKAQNDYFRSFFVYWQPGDGSMRIPVFPGGYFVGCVLLVNLLTAHFTRFKLTRKKIGIWLIHIGIILLLVGQLLTDLLSQESAMHLRENETKNYSEIERRAELAVIDTTDADLDTVVAIPQARLKPRTEIRHSKLPFALRVKEFYLNSQAENRSPESFEPPAASRGVGVQAVVREMPKVTDTDHRDIPSAIVEIMTPQGSIGTWLLSEWIERPQMFTFQEHSYQLALRPQRQYKPFSVKLLKFTHDLYRGTDIPKNFSSRVLVDRPDTGEKREVDIYMNNPLRYAGETYYQASWDKDDHGTILQVVHNPGWLTPYFSCVLVGIGLVVQFCSSLFGFAFKRRST